MTESKNACEFPLHRTPKKDVRELLRTARVVAVVGLSANPQKASHRVAAYLQEHGYRIIPVNPRAEGMLLGETVYPDLASVPKDAGVEIADVFRPAEEVPALVEAAVAMGAKALWLQEGIVHNAAAERARQAGLTVVMDLCMMKEHRAAASA